LSVAFGLAWPAKALDYKAKENETLSHVAAIFYGAGKKHIYLSAINRIADPNRISRGKKIVIPTVWPYRFKRGDDLAKVANRFLRDPKRGEFLRWYNQIQNPRNIAVGERINIPFIIPHRVSKGQGFRDIAKLYYFGRTQILSKLRQFNNKKNLKLEAGELIWVPVLDPEAKSDRVQKRYHRHLQNLARLAKLNVRKQRLVNSPVQVLNSLQKAADASSAKPPPEPNINLDPVLKRGSDATKAQPLSRAVASKLFFDGQFEEALDRLRRLELGQQLGADEEVRVQELLARCLVALDRLDEAEKEFSRLLKIAPQHQLDPMFISPKVRDVFQRAKP
jgi:tetratricopeptide (TPR) repeat protein